MNLQRNFFGVEGEGVVGTFVLWYRGTSHITASFLPSLLKIKIDGINLYPSNLDTKNYQFVNIRFYINVELMYITVALIRID